MKRVALITAGVIVFLLISGLLARFLLSENAELNADVSLLQAQARGDVNGMLDQLSGCRESPACLVAVRTNASSLRRRGAVKILSLKSSTAYSLTGATGKTRLAWTVIGRLPVVQCVQVRRTGSFFSGIKITLLSLSTPISNEGTC